MMKVQRMFSLHLLRFSDNRVILGVRSRNILPMAAFLNLVVQECAKFQQSCRR